MNQSKEGVARLSPFTCTNCRAVLGYTNGKVIDLETATVDLPITVYCKNCGGSRLWKPASSKTFFVGGSNKPEGPQAA